MGLKLLYQVLALQAYIRHTGPVNTEANQIITVASISNHALAVPPQTPRGTLLRRFLLATSPPPPPPRPKLESLSGGMFSPLNA